MNGRRKWLLAAGAAAAATAGGLLWRQRSRDERGVAPEGTARREPPALPPDPAFPNALNLPGSDGMHGILDVAGTLTIVAKPVRHAVLPGKPTAMLAFEVEHQGRRFLNPILRVRSGAQFRARFWNALEDPSIIHWHGLKVDSNNDGHPHYAVPGGATYHYQFTVANRAATYWYHPHPHHLTGKQVYLGLTGLFIVEDDDEQALREALDLRLGATDIPLIIQDRALDESGQLSFVPDDGERFDGYRGGVVLVNGTPRPFFDTASRILRFRILNGSNARMYRLAFRRGDALLEFHVIGTDGGLLPQPHAAREAFVSPSERVDVLLDLTAAQRGDAVTLSSLAFDPMEHEGSAGSHTGHAGHHSEAVTPPKPPAPGEGDAMDLLRIRVATGASYHRAIPAVLAQFPGEDGRPRAKPRVITLDVKGGRWRINGRTYEQKATPIVVRRDTPEVWEIRNARQSMPHPFHVHGFQFKVISRRGSPEQQSRLAVTKEGLACTDLGWKDTVLTWPGESVRIALDFSHPYPGDQVYMVHCHNLEHEDGGMMLNMKVTS
jgi:suppressor of ftsI/bilirubin oxidase